MDTRQTKFALAGAVAGIALIAMQGSNAQAATVTLTAANGFGASSLNTATGWSDGLAPSAGNDYANAGFLLRTPNNGNDLTFAGDSLTITGNGANGLSFKGAGTGETITVNDLRLVSDGVGPLPSIVGGYSNGGVGVHSATLAGNITVFGGTNASNSPQIAQTANTAVGFGVTTFTISASISGNSAVVFSTAATTFNGSQSIVLGGASPNTYTGGTFIGFGGTGGVRGLIFRAIKDGAFGSGDVSYGATNGSIELTGGTTNNYIGDAARLIVPAALPAGSVNLNYTGTDVVAGVSFDGGATFLTAPGTYGSAASGADNPNAAFIGSGTLTIVPEPATLGLLSLAGALGFGRRRRD